MCRGHARTNRNWIGQSITLKNEVENLGFTAVGKYDGTYNKEIVELWNFLKLLSI